MVRRYFLSVNLGGEEIEKEVSVEEYCRAERQAGFYPKVLHGDKEYLITPATGGFGSGVISGRIKYETKEKE
jgi:hypothetical protein